MTFSIGFKEESVCYPYDDPSTPAAKGFLVLGDFREEFLSSLYQWKQKDYQKQWRYAFDVLLNETGKSALITEYCSPNVATHLGWWPMYSAGNTVFFQNHLLFYEQLSRPFVVENALSFLHDRKTASLEGDKISEWHVPRSEVEAFVRTLHP